MIPRSDLSIAFMNNTDSEDNYVNNGTFRLPQSFGDIEYVLNTYSLTPVVSNYQLKVDFAGDGNESDMYGYSSDIIVFCMPTSILNVFGKNGVTVNGITQSSTTVRFKFNKNDPTNAVRYRREGSLFSYKYYIDVAGDVTIIN